MVATEKLTLIHFNDVYNVEAREKQEPVGGAARMRTAIKKYADRNPLILFSGDCFAPSICKCLVFEYCILGLIVERIMVSLNIYVAIFFSKHVY